VTIYFRAARGQVCGGHASATFLHFLPGGKMKMLDEEGSVRRAVVVDSFGGEHQAVVPFRAPERTRRSGHAYAAAGVLALGLVASVVMAAGRHRIAMTTNLLARNLVLPNGWLLVRVNDRVLAQRQHAQQLLVHERSHEGSAAKLLNAPAERVAKDKKRLLHDERRLISLELPDIVKDMPDPTASCNDKKGNKLRAQV